MNFLQTYKGKLSDKINTLKLHLANYESEDFHNIFIFLISSSYIFFAGLIWGAVYFVAGAKFASILPWLYSLVSLLSFIFLYFSQNYKLFYYIQVLDIIIIPFLLSAILGGLMGSAAVILWSIMAPISAIIFGSYKDVKIFLSTVIVLFIIEGIHGLLFNFSISTLSVVTAKAMLILNIICPIIIIIYIIIHYSKELTERNVSISKTLEDLKKYQSQLTQAEKMAGLGQLIATVAHEINTPSAAIQTSISEIENNYPISLDSYLKVLKELTDESQAEYSIVLQELLSIPTSQVTTKEQRLLCRELNDVINEKFPNSFIVNDIHFINQLVLIGYNKNNICNLLTFINNFQEVNPIKDKVMSSIEAMGLNKNHINNIKIAISRINRMISALRSYSRSDASATLVETNIADDLETTITLFGNKLVKQVNLTKNFTPIPLFKGYPDQLNQVWTNLIQNSLQAINGEGSINMYLYSYKGKIDFKESRSKPLIKVINDINKYDSNQEFIIFEIEDTGAGISDTVVPRLFEAYFTTKQKGIGTGLGLSISKEIIERHNGVILVYSQTGVGTCMQIILPIV